MQRLMCIIEYDGSGFAGYQVQPNKRTVQGVIERALGKIHKGDPIRSYASGRTDASVHACGQVVHFDSYLKIPPNRWTKAINTLLPDDVYVISSHIVNDSFHSRFNVTSKEYRYKIDTSSKRNVFRRRYAYYFPYSLDYVAMKEAIKYLVGTNDFTSFCSAKTNKEDKVRTIYEIEFEREADELTFRFVGDGFLYNMVRIIIGTLLEVGQGKIESNEVKEILDGKNRSLAGKLVPGHGLYLWKVNYDN